ncbi:MAG: cyclic nucleotide-binding domain-containing protein [Pseudomonadota bacterium]
MTISDAERVKRELLLRSLFPSMPVAANVRFIELLEDVELAAGQLAFAQGEAPDRFLFLTEGRVIMEGEGQLPLEFSGLAVVGVMDAVLNRPRVRACRALEPSKALAVRTTDWFDMLEDNAEVARAATRNFATRLYDRWHELAPKLARHSTPPPGVVPKAFENYDKILVLRQAAFLKRAGMQAVASLATVAEPLSLNAGDALFEANNEGRHFYVVGAGLIELSQPGGFRITHTTSDLVGGPASFCNALPNYAAHALTDAIVLRISQQDFYDQAEEHGRLVRGTLAFLISELEAVQAVAEPRLEVNLGAAAI